jgi:hypothetical protein
MRLGKRLKRFVNWGVCAEILVEKKNSLKNDSRKIDKKRCIRDIWETVLVLLRQSREQELKLIIFVKLN